MKTFGALLAVILFASSPVLGQADNPNAELDLWREAMADYNRRSEEVRQQYAADRELWRTHFEEATRPLSTGKKILKGLAYAGDKTLTGVVNYYSSRAAIRSEMGRFDSRFESLRDGIQASRTDMLAATEGSRTDILGATERSRTDMLAATEGSRTDILGATERSRTDMLAATEGSRTDILSATERSRTDILGATERSTADVLAGIREAEADITDRIGRQGETIEDILESHRPSCTTPFGPREREGCN